VNVVVSTREEQQNLAAGQTVVNLTTTNTSGLAIYVEGNRLAANEWTPDPVVKTRLTLAKSYTAGWTLVAVQNEPARALAASLLAASNLADVADMPTARANLSVYSKAETDVMTKQAGEVFFTARSTAPAGSLKANGAAISRTAYAALFAAIGTTYGAGDGFNTFNLPDLRGEFLRGTDDGRGIDAGRQLGSWQGSQNLSHTHAGTTDAGGVHTHTLPTYARDGSTNGSTGDGGPSRTYTSTTDQGGSHTHTFTTAAAGGTEARPRNVALLACIKF
jgi:phage-related tail fiber protein